MYDVAKQASGDAFAVDIVFYVVGKLTSRLAELPAGGALEVWGPLGNGFLPRPAEHLIMVAGGIGQTPFMALAKECLGRQQYGAPPRPAAHATKVTLCYGARSADLFAGLDDFAALGVETLLATDDGSQGRRGLVTDVFRDALAAAPDGSRVVCCGPEPMMEAVALICREGGVACEVSLETPMACGLGICFSCVARVSERDGTWDYKRTCVEGPVFDAARLVW
jgi:dihydroorotate dehydrogenase electron transfer subunit